MPARDETMLFSAIATLLAALAFGGLADFASPDAQAVTNARERHVSRPVADARELHASRSGVCAPASAAPAEPGAAGQRG